MRLDKASIALALFTVIAMTLSTPQPSAAKQVDESWFDVRVTLEFQSGEILEPVSGFNIETEDEFLYIEIWIDTVQSPVGEIHLVLLRVNGETLLRELGIVRVDMANYDNVLEIEAYGEGFVKYTDTAYEDLLEGTISRHLPQETSPYPIFIIIGLIAGLVVYLDVKH